MSFRNGRSDTSFQAVLQDDDMVRAQPAAGGEAPAMNNPLIRDMDSGFLVDQAQLAPSPYGTAPSQAIFNSTAGHGISVYGDSQSSISYDDAASMQFSQLLKPSVPASAPMQGGGGAPMLQYCLSGGYLPFGGPLPPSQLLLQALQTTKPSSRSSNANSLTVKVRHAWESRYRVRFTTIQSRVSPSHSLSVSVGLQFRFLPGRQLTGDEEKRLRVGCRREKAADRGAIAAADF